MTKDEERSDRVYKAWETRRLYEFEINSKILRKEKLHIQVPIKTLISEAKSIWKKVFFFRMTNFPDIRLGPGVKHGSRMTSYYHWYNHEIEFAPGERDRITLAHELVHAYGREYHDFEFIFQEFKIFSEAYNVSLSELSNEAETYKLSYQPCIF